MKTLLLVSGGIGRPPNRELALLEEQDKYPRVTLFPRALDADILDEHFLQSVSPVRRAFYRILPTFAAQVLEAFLVRRRYDAVICWAEHLGLPLALLFKLTGVRRPHLAIFSWISKRKKAEVLRRVHTHIDRIVLMSSVQRDFALNRIGVPPARITFLKWPVDQRFWRPMDCEADMICTVGSEMRDFRTLVEALRGLDINCHVAAGTHVKKPSSSVAELQRMLPLPRNITVGAKPPLELRMLYARSRFVVVPLHATDTDNGTTTILEAMAMGKAVICSRTEGQVDVIREGETGLFVPVGDVDALRKTILSLWNRPAEAERMGREARRLVEKFHTLDEFVERVKKTVDVVVQERVP